MQRAQWAQWARSIELLHLGSLRVQQSRSRAPALPVASVLYLPPTAVDNQAVQGGRIIATGPGLPMPDPGETNDEPWRTAARETRFVPMQARVGDYALFFRRAAVEISFENERYLVVPQTAILALVRGSAAPER